MKIYSTKYCLTTGIHEHDAEVNGEVAKYMDGRYTRYIYGEGKDWHRTKKAAIERAEERRIKKLQSLDKQAKKIANLIFDI